MRRARGLSLVEVIAATSIGVVFVGVFASQLASDALALRHAAEDARARAALQNAYERLQAGSVEPAADGPVRVTVEAGRTDEPRLVAADLVPVVLRASWRGADGKPRARELTTLAPRHAIGGAR